MQSIPEKSGSASGVKSDRFLSLEGCERASASDEHARVAGEACLDLIFGHLTTSTNQYQPVQRNTLDNSHPDGWFRPSGDWSAHEENNLVLKIQPFKAGGFEATIRPVCLPELARMLDAPRKSGQREAPQELDRDNQIRSIKRSKTKARHLMKSMGADRLLTLTKRESDPALFWSLDDWSPAWAKFVRLCKKAGIDLQYVAVPERHKKGNYHLHVAINAKVNIKLIRQLWWACCGGRGQGNVDVSYKHHMTATARVAGIARYLSKYLTKQFGQSEFNRKRYWASRHELPKAIRIILNALDLLDGLVEASDLLQLDVRRVIGSKYGAYIYPSKDNPQGVWLNWSEDLQGLPF